MLDVDTGYFTTEVGLGDALDLSVFATTGEVWVEIEVEGEVLEPRIQFGIAPYAAWANWAGDAQTIGGTTLEELQAPADWAEITGIPDDLLDGDDVGEDVDLSGYQTILTSECPEGQSIRAIAPDGTVTCETDDDTTYTVGDGLSLADATFAIDFAMAQARVTGECPEGSSIRAINRDGTVICQDDTDTDTTYSAGDGIALADTTFSDGRDQRGDDRKWSRRFFRARGRRSWLRPDREQLDR